MGLKIASPITNLLLRFKTCGRWFAKLDAERRAKYLTSPSAYSFSDRSPGQRTVLPDHDVERCEKFGKCRCVVCLH